MLKLLLVDDEELSRYAFKVLISKYFTDIQIVAEADNGLAAIRAYKSYLPDVVILDIHMPGMNGLQTLQEIISINPDANVLIYSAYDHFDYVSQAMDLGAKGYLLKPVTNEELAEKLRHIQHVAEVRISKTKQAKLSDQSIVEMLLAGTPGKTLKVDLKNIFHDRLEHGIIASVSYLHEQEEEVISALLQIKNEIIPNDHLFLNAIIDSRLIFFYIG